MNLNESLKSAKEISFWLHHKVGEIDIPNRKREVAAVSLFQQTLDITDAIVLLLESNLPGPALALVRPMHEGYVRAVWLLNHASDDSVDKFIRGKCPNFKALLEEIGDAPETGGSWIKGMTEMNLKDFHGLTHGGMEHVVRRIVDDSIEPNYTELELFNVVKARKQYCINIVVYLFTLIENESGLAELNQKRREWKKAL